MNTLFGKPRSEVIKHPGALTKSAHKAGESPMEFASEHKHDSGKTGQRARLALTLRGMHKKANGGVMMPGNGKPMLDGMSQPKKRRVRFECGGMVK